MQKYKVYILVSLDALKAMGGNRGKLAAQVGHAVLHSVWDAQKRFPSDVAAYQDSDHAFKIALTVPDQVTLEKFKDAYQNVCGVSLVKDAGFTVFKEPTVTCLGIGPIPEDRVGEDLKALSTLR